MGLNRVLLLGEVVRIGWTPASWRADAIVDLTVRVTHECRDTRGTALTACDVQVEVPASLVSGVSTGRSIAIEGRLRLSDKGYVVVAERVVTP